MDDSDLAAAVQALANADYNAGLETAAGNLGSTDTQGATSPPRSEEEDVIAAANAGDNLEGEASKAREGLHDEKEIESLMLREDMPMRERLELLNKSENEIQRTATLSLLPRYLEELCATIDDPASDSDTRASAQSESDSVLLDVLCKLQPLLQDAMGKDDELTRQFVLARVGRIIDAVRSATSRDILLGCSLELSNQLAARTSYGLASPQDIQMMLSMVKVMDSILSSPRIEPAERQRRAADLGSLCCEKLSDLASCGARSFGAYLLGLLAKTKYLEHVPDAQRSQLNSLAVAMCQDVDTEVRTAMTAQLGHLADADAAWFEKEMLAEFVELLGDEEVMVKTGAVEALGTVSCALSASSFGERIFPVFLREVEASVAHTNDSSWANSFPKEAQLVREVALALGPALVAREEQLKTDDADALDSQLCRALSAFRAFAGSVDVTTRCVSAYIFPGVLKAVGAGRFAKLLADTFKMLATDAHVEVRKGVAETLEPVSNLLGKQRVARLLFEIIVGLGKDESREVRRIVVDAWPVLQEKFTVADEKQRAALHKDLFEPCMTLLLPESRCRVVGADWRYRVAGLEVFDKVSVDLYDPERIHQRCVPVMLDLMRYGAEPLRRAAARSLARVVAKNPVARRDPRLVHDIKCEFARGVKWTSRVLFIIWCQELGAQCSGHLDFFEKHYLEDALGVLASDRVPSVRMVFAQAALELTETGILTREFAGTALAAAMSSGKDLASEVEAAQARLEQSGIQDDPDVVKRRQDARAKEQRMRRQDQRWQQQQEQQQQQQQQSGAGAGRQYQYKTMQSAHSSLRRLPVVSSAQRSRRSSHSDSSIPTNELKGASQSRQPLRTGDWAATGRTGSATSGFGSESESSCALDELVPCRPSGAPGKASVRSGRIKRS